ncbi:bacterial Ig-like domain-containing protein, partial [Paenibacillus whitsoniae]
MRQKRITAMLLSLCLLFAMLPTAALAADPLPMISIPSGSVWKGSVFGDLGGTPNSTNFGVTEKSGGSVTLMAKGGKGKIKTSSPSSEGLAYYYQEVSPQDNFELKAKATVDVWTSATDAQQSFGIMLRNDILDNLSQSGYSGEYLAAGAIDNRLQVFYKNSITDAVAKNMFSDVTAPSGGQSYDISIQKSGSVYKLTVNGETQVLPQQITSSFNYVGLFVARNTTVTFTDVSFHKDNRAPSSIAVDASAFKKSYFVGDSLDLSGLKVTAAFQDLHEELLAAGDYIVDGFSSKTAGDHSLTIYYNGQSAAVPGTIHVAPRVVTALDVQYMPAKTDYYPGDHLDTQGMIVQAQYNGGGDWATLGSNEYTLSLPPTDASYSVTTATYTLTTPGVTTVTVRSTVTTDTYTSFDVNVNNAELTTLEITHAPNKTSYFVGDTFDQAGLVVTARYSNGASVKLLRSEYNVELTDGGLATPGAKSLTVKSYKKPSLVSAPVTITVATPAVTHVAVTTYPTTTFAVNQEIDLTGMKVSAVYDNKTKAELAASEYDVDTTAYNKSQPGTYYVVITPHNTALPAVQLPVTVKAAYVPEWKSIRFGQSTSDANNKIEVLSDTSVRLTALEGGGKVTGDHDGISFYYVELDPTKDNFTLSANIKVTAFAKDQYDGQESFGIMARDAIGTAGDSSIFASNIAAVGGYSGGTTKPIGTQLFIRTGVDAPNAGSAGVQSKMLSSVRPTTSNTYPAANYKLTLTKTNSGFTGSLNGSEPVKFYAPDIMSVQGTDTMYVGFYTARLATIEVSDIDLKVSAAATDAPIEMPPADPTAPVFRFTSLTRTSNPIYNLTMNANVAGKVTIKQGASVLGSELAMTAGTTLTVPTTVTANTYTNFSAVFVPDDAQYLTSYDKIVQNHTVTMKTFAVGGDIYAAWNGTSDGDGTAEHPLDLDTAIDYVAAGQKILLLDGRYERSTKLDIKKGNDGAAGAYKYLVAAPGAKPILDFAKKSEGVVLSGSYWHVKGIDVTRSASNTKGFTIGGSNNIVEGSRFYANGDTGLQISRTDESAPRAEWPSNNLILNCESFDNVDPSNNNADGFAAKLTAGTGNIFRGDISHNNIDDGWDLYTKAGTGAIGAVLIEDSIAYNNGVLTDGTVGAGDKNGFKLGGEGIHVPHMIRNSIAFGNGAYGFSSNSNPGVRVEATNIGFNNAKGNLNLTSYTGITLDFALDGFLSYQKNYTAKDNYPASLNSATNYMWNGTKSVNKLGQQLSDANFASLTPVLPYERDASGAIVKGHFLRYIPTVV